MCVKYYIYSAGVTVNKSWLSSEFSSQISYHALKIESRNSGIFRHHAREDTEQSDISLKSQGRICSWIITHISSLEMSSSRSCVVAFTSRTRYWRSANYMWCVKIYLSLTQKFVEFLFYSANNSTLERKRRLTRTVTDSVKLVLTNLTFKYVPIIYLMMDIRDLWKRSK